MSSSGYIISSYMLMENKKLHTKGFGGGGNKWCPRLNILINNSHMYKILDFGCGAGTLKPCLNAFVDEYDPAIPGKDTLPEKQYDLTVCTDVLEHVEPEYLENVLTWIKDHTEWAFFSIATRPSNKFLSTGKNCHLILEDKDWWKARLEKHFAQVFEEQPLRKGEVVFVCKK